MNGFMSSLAPAAPEKEVPRSVYSDECLDALSRWQGIDAKPDSENRKKRNGIRIFRHSLMELCLTKSPWYVPWLFTVPIMAGGLWWGGSRGLSGWQLAGAFLAGILLWTLLEYLLHRWLFHYTPK